jgi:hypothetical protein
MAELCDYCHVPLKGQIVYEKRQYRDGPLQLTFGYDCCFRKGHHNIFCDGACFLDLRVDDANLEEIYKLIDTIKDTGVRNAFVDISRNMHDKLMEPVLCKIDLDLKFASNILGHPVKPKRD